MFLNLKDIILLLHPILACTFIFPVLGITAFFALQTRQRRLKDSASISTTVGSWHVKLGKLLAAGVIGITLVALAYSVVFGFQGFLMQAENNTLQPLSVVLVALMFIATIAATVLLYRAQSRLWRAVFATLSGMGVVILAFQPGVFRRDDEWWASHFYFGLGAVMLMIFSVAMVREIYQDRSLTWRRIHIGLNSLALILFLLQGITGTRDLLEIPLSWQAPVVYRCNFDPQSPQFKTCP
ncbi:DUF4079 domain-containing protein [Thermosynechococcus sp.]|uniref:DUF4079 domain-containing protein n=1 Tax=Thermosynechococcus sp. TaxID=2814275 RepID=UPI00391BABEF